jgi:hypothetical protein
MNNTAAARIAADIIDARRQHIEDIKDVAWYVAEEGLDERTADMVTAIIVEKLGL